MGCVLGLLCALQHSLELQCTPWLLQQCLALGNSLLAIAGPCGVGCISSAYCCNYLPPGLSSWRCSSDSSLDSHCNLCAMLACCSKTRGLGAGRKLRTHRREQLWADKDYKKSHLGNEWKKPFAGASHAKGIVLEKM